MVRVRVKCINDRIGFGAFQSFPYQIMPDPFSTRYSGKQKDPEHACSEYRGSEDIIVIIVRMKKMQSLV